MSYPYAVTKQLEHDLCEYTGARYAVAVNSGTAALLLACQWEVRRVGGVLEGDESFRPSFSIPKCTYVSVPMSIINAGGSVIFRNEIWRGAYRLEPTEIWDCARRFTSGMYVAGQFQCLSFSSSKILGIEQGGAILHDDFQADAWFRRMRFDGRAEGVSTHEDTFNLIGHHCLMLPSIAAQLVLKLHHLSKHNEDLPHLEYPDLSRHKAFS